MGPLHRSTSSRERAAALIIVLAFVVLLTGLAVAYLSRTTLDRSVAHSSFNQSKADLLVASATDSIVGDLRQEIVNGSTATPVNGATIYTPTSAANMIPQRSENAAGVPNLIRRSVRLDPILPPGLGSRASAANSTTDISANGRFVTSTRWNSHYLVPKKDTGTDDPVPIDAFTSATPDWVFVTNNGAAPITQPSASVLGRYAYAIYDEGGLLDMNVAGYPTGTTIYQYGRKGSLAFADLTAPSPYSIQNPNSDPTPVYQVDRLVGWRNYGSTQPSNNFPESSPAQAFAKNFQTSATPATKFYSFVVNNTNGFLQVRGSYSPSPSPWPYASPSPYPAGNERTDQLFLNRQQLIAFRNTTGFSSNTLQYLTHFTREAEANSPQWSPTTPTLINPNFQTLRVTGSGFLRNDGSAAIAGEYLVKKRFLLQQLNWLTYKGPSANRTIPTSAPAIGSGDYDMWLLTRQNGLTFGLTSAFLSKGTDLSQATQTASTANIYKYFGLVWNAANEGWNYIGHPASPTASSPLATSIATLDTITDKREPDFFELLQAGILDSSLGDASSPDPALPIVHQQSKMLHILTIGANLIAQSRVDSYPVRIAFSSGGTPMEAVGTPRLPYNNSLAACAVGATQSPAGGVHWLLVPNLWDPFRDSWDLTEANASNSGNGPLLTPGYLRPQTRIRITGSVSFGSVPAAASVKSGSVASDVPVTTFSSLTGIDSNLPLVSGATTNNWHGRDGFLEASRLRTNDVSGSVTQFTTTNSPTTPLFEWNSLTTTGMTQIGQGGNQRWIVFRVSLPGANIPPSAFPPNAAQNPVLILNPGFQMTVEYQSPNNQWYPYSYLQGNSASSNTWIGKTTPQRNLNLVTDYSVYGKLSGTIPTIVNYSDPATATTWATATLADAPMFAKADPRSIRYDSQIGVVNLSSPPMAVVSAGVIGSIWPDTYATPPPMWTTASPGPTPSPNPNPATYSQIADNGPANSNPYNENSSSSAGDTVRPIMMNRPFRSVGEMGYAFRDQPFKTLDFSSASSPDAGLLDLFTVNDYSDTSGARAGVVNLNTRQAAPLAAVIASTITREATPRQMSSGNPSPAPVPIANTQANNSAASIVLANATPLVNKANLTNLIATETGLGPLVPKTQRESIARALGEADQTRTWNLMIDVIAQSGRYPPNANNLGGFVVEGEQRYWVHVAIDRFSGQVIDRQIEVVKE
jgi:hypothetical protein